jgi:hypothetical protein
VFIVIDGMSSMVQCVRYRSVTIDRLVFEWLDPGRGDPGFKQHNAGETWRRVCGSSNVESLSVEILDIMF